MKPIAGRLLIFISLATLLSCGQENIITPEPEKEVVYETIYIEKSFQRFIYLSRHKDKGAFL